MRFYEVLYLNNLTEKEKNAIKYYIGDVSGDDSFYGDGKAYVVLNSLFFPDIYSEKMRAGEGKLLNPAILEDVPRLLDFFNSLFSAFGKSVLEKSCRTYRVERMGDFEIFRSKGRTISMTSTSLSGFLDAYRDRRGIALVEFNLCEGINCIDVSKALDNYVKAEETEILLPPFMEIDIQEKEMKSAERLITDCDGNPPVISTAVSVKGICSDICTSGIHISDCKAGMRIYNALNSNEIPDSEDIAEYSQWKRILRKLLYSILYQYVVR